MGIALAQFQIGTTTDRLHHMATLVTTDHTGRHIGSPHQGSQGTGVVTAEPHLLIKQKSSRSATAPG